jgi:hypothetical protein
VVGKNRGYLITLISQASRAYQGMTNRVSRNAL